LVVVFVAVTLTPYAPGSANVYVTCPSASIARDWPWMLTLALSIGSSRYSFEMLNVDSTSSSTTSGANRGYSTPPYALSPPEQYRSAIRSIPRYGIGAPNLHPVGLVIVCTVSPVSRLRPSVSALYRVAYTMFPTTVGSLMSYAQPMPLRTHCSAPVRASTAYIASPQDWAYTVSSVTERPT
jgi:hypothetical protein